MNPAPSVSPASTRLERFGPWWLGALTFLPLIVWRARIGEFFWFGDDFDLLNQISEIGLGRWIVRPWAESWSPVFKTVWGTSALAFGGSYFAMLSLVWLSSALTVAATAAVMRRSGFGWTGTLPALLVVGLTATNIETLCWSVQLSPAMANAFFAAALLLHLGRAERSASWSWRAHGPVLACIAASALCYSRGVLTGAVLAAAALLPAAGAGLTDWRRRVGLAGAYLAPAIAVAVVIMLATGGNQTQLLATDAARLARMFWFGAWYFCLNPFYHLISPGTWGPHTTLAFGVLKIALIAGALQASRGTQRRLLVLLLLFDLGNSVLLGLGRYHTGLGVTAGSRYQYCSLLATMPFVAFWLERVLGLLPAWRHVRLAVVGSLAVALTVGLVRGWNRELDLFVGWRGTQPRQVLLGPAALPPDFQTPGIPFLPPERARELIVRYHLH